MIIDFHTHIFEDLNAPRIMEDMDERAQVPSYSDGTLSGLLTSMDEAGVDISVVSRITTKPERVDAVNGWLKAIRSERTIPIATLQPGEPRIWEHVDRLKKEGFRGFKLHPDYQGFFVDETRIFPFYEAVQDAGLWILFHAGLDRGLPGHPVHATPQRLLRVIESFPRLVLIAAHMGGEEIYEETERYLLGRDIYLDTSYVLRKMPRDTLRRFAARHPAERILFGSDHPWSHQGRDLEYLLSLPFLSIAHKEKITCTNAAELLGIRTVRPAWRAGGDRPVEKGVRSCFLP